jgi:hypothetical protein
MTLSGNAAIRPGARHLWLAACGIALVLALTLAPAAHGERALLPSLELKTKDVPGGQIEGACGVAVSGGTIYVSDYYHHGVDAFGLGGGGFLSRIAGNPLDGPCGLATSAGGALYANDWHEGVSRLLPSTLSFDSAESTGVAVDQASGDVYVDDREYVAVYEPSGAAVMASGKPLRIGLAAPGVSTLGDGYGVAVFAGKVYVPDASDNTVKVYEPATDAVNPSSVIDGAALPGGGFSSLVDAAVAVDPGNEHLLVVDNLQPGFEHPEAAIDEFDAAGALLGQVGKRIVDGEPSGLFFSGGILYATTGNDEGANVFSFGPYTVGSLQSTSSPALAAAPMTFAAPSEMRPEGAPAIAPELRLVASRPGTAGSGATIRALVSSPGSVSVSGPGLRSLQALRVAAGAQVLRLHLDRAGSKALKRSKRHRLTVPVGVTFAPDGGDPVQARRAVTFRQASRGNR